MSEYTGHYNDCDAVPIKVNRVFDSCSDKDCITGVQVDLNCSLPSSITIVKPSCITVSDVCMNVEAIPFNKGFYSVDLTFSFDIQLIGYEKACGDPTILTGTATVSKNCILYGSETNSKTFFSDGTSIGTTGNCCNTVNPPVASVQVVSPLVLEAKIVKGCKNYDCGCCDCCEGKMLPPPRSQNEVVLTLGLFYVVELIRPVTIMVPTYSYTIPQKECCADMDSPCEIFDKIKFPTEEFSPAKLENSSCGCAYPADMKINNNDDDCGCQNI
ncbi:hypothetical protein [Porcipelethomonas sp.]|uniref:hypothetical protein n=1 Tax=Porcipelethomonas sp. TaxID=2981675 RepID=UPI003EF59BBE